MLTQVAIDAKSSQGNVTVRQKKTVSVASKFGKLQSHMLLNLPPALGEVSGCAFLFSYIRLLVSAVGHFLSGEKIIGGSLFCIQ